MRSRPLSPAPRQCFLLSPARADGRRGALLFRDAASFPLAMALRTRQGAPIGEVYAFLSGLYFRGKLAYAEAFARPRPDGVWVILPGRGLVPPDTRVTLDDLAAVAALEVDADEPRYARPLAGAAATLAATLQGGTVVLLGSIATGKYVDVLAPVLGDALRFPGTFVGRGDMSRGGLMLRCVDAGEELTYVPLAEAVRRGPRPPKLAPRARRAPARA